MYLAEDKPQTETQRSELPKGPLAATAPSAGGKWHDFPNSEISHHGEACCDIAHEWLVAFDFAQLNGGDVLTGPRWMREHSTWGPSAWPIHWCEAVDRKVADCGAHAAMAHAAFIARGLRAFRAQFVLRYSADAAASWHDNWTRENVSGHWIDGEVVYHEGNAVLVDEDTIKLWDGSAGCWLNPRQLAGYGSLAAVRVAADLVGFADGFRWGERRIKLNRWVSV